MDVWKIGGFLALQMASQAILLTQKIRTLMTHAAFRIETIQFVFSSFVCVCYREKHVFMMVLDSTHVTPNYMFSGAMFQMDFWCLLFYHASTVHDSFSSSLWPCRCFVPPYHLISVLVTSDQLKGTYSIYGVLPFLVLNCIVPYHLLKENKQQ